ncbi:uncharacterized protein LOC142355317 [Convolutriloba macropyga]|uniref:uncharacterized protein LOC142355317 n=1 Tax=Convolutriloba macropyga TaxID=536237 RepID=UPI003F522924
MKVTFVNCFLTALLFVICCLESAQSQLSDYQKQDALDTHNFLRNKLGWKDRKGQKFSGNQVNMRVLFWDDNLEQLAQQAADMCPKDHMTLSGAVLTELKREYGQIGENIYWEAGYWKKNDVGKFIEKWYSEVEFYRWDKHNCYPKGECDHFTQLIWADTEAVGCAMSKCLNSGNGKTWTSFVCEYGPSGNFKNQVPFKTTTNKDNICTAYGLEPDSKYTKSCAQNIIW